MTIKTPLFFLIKSLPVKYSQKNNGFTITEMMIAISIGVVLMAGISQIYLSSKQTYAMNDELIAFQENGRYITSRIAGEVRMAGHAGCVDTFERGMQFAAADFNAATRDFYITPIQVFEYSATASPNPSLPNGTTAPAVDILSPVAAANSDIISIQYGSYVLNQITADMSSTNANINVNASNSLMQDIIPGNMLIIADCDMANVFIAGDPSSNSVVSHSALSKTFSQMESGLWPTVMHFISNTYYVGTNNGVNALYVRDNISGNTAKIFEGIQSMDILYGVRDSSGSRYMDGDAIVAANLMNNIFSTRISFNLQSRKQVDTATASGTSKDYITKQFTSTVVLRNQGDW
ncbi:MAG: PilW family protein [Pseudomonadota bacterium]